MKKLYFLFFLPFITVAQAPAGYYDDANGLEGASLKTALKTIIDAQDDGNGQPFHDTSNTYGDLWDLYEVSDVRSDGFVWEMYGDCDFVFGTAAEGGDQDNGTGGNAECEKFNREHSFPRSWFGNDQNHPIFYDPFNVIPSDKKVNAERGNLAYGEVASANYTSGNGSKKGSSAISGPTGNVFEITDEFKGDIARSFFYLATRYQDDIGSWEANDSDGNSMLDGSSYQVFEQWALDMLYNWHANDAVSQKEIDRNNAIFNFQDNRNPFIDNPQYVDDIWFPLLSVNQTSIEETVNIHPNPVSKGQFFITTQLASVDLVIYDVLGNKIGAFKVENSQAINVSSYKSGLYLLKINAGERSLTKKLIIQ